LVEELSYESFQRFALRIHVRRTELLISIKDPTSDNIFIQAQQLEQNLKINKKGEKLHVQQNKVKVVIFLKRELVRFHYKYSAKGLKKAMFKRFCTNA